MRACGTKASLQNASRRAKLLGAGFAALVVCLLSLLPAQASNARWREQDGIVAQLDLDETQAVVSWRFAHRPPSLLDKVEARVNGRVVGTPSVIEAFPAPGDSVLVTFLIDDGGLERAAAIDEAERAILDTIKAMPSFVHSRVTAYDVDFRRVDLNSSASAYVDLRAAAGPKDAVSDLTLALRSAILSVAVEPATRRAIYVYTDGYNAGAKALDDIALLAQSAGVSVSLVLTPSMRLADLALLDHFATTTGGRLLTRPATVRDDIVMFLASGGRVRFPVDSARHFIWERAETLDVTLVYGDATLSLTSDIETPLAGLGQTAIYLWQTNPQLVILTSLISAICVLGVVIGWRINRKRQKIGVARAPRQPLKS